MAPTYCTACGGDGWLPSLPEGQSECPYCKGTGKGQGVISRKLPHAYIDNGQGRCRECNRVGVGVGQEPVVLDHSRKAV